MTPSHLLIPTYRNLLTALGNWLRKAAEQVDDADRLMAERLAPDMFPLSTQIRFACVQAHEGGHRLMGNAIPGTVEDLLNEGRAGGEQPGTLAQALIRIDETLAALDGFDTAAMDGAGDKPLGLELPIGIAFDFDGETYVRDWALPQFYFHIMTAYSILRHKGVELGKADYVAHMFAYLRKTPETAG